MSEKLKIETQILDNKVVVDLLGSIDEDADFEKVLSLNSREYVFDFDQVTMINSCGIREWINFIEKLSDNSKISYRNCRQIIIEQMNMVHGFLKKGAQIESFYAPYFCENCDEERKVHLKTSSMQGKKAPIVKCEKCHGEMEFDAIEEQYFGFIGK